MELSHASNDLCLRYFPSDLIYPVVVLELSGPIEESIYCLRLSSGTSESRVYILQFTDEKHIKRPPYGIAAGPRL